MNLIEQLLDTRCVGCREWGTLACNRCVTQWTRYPIRDATPSGIPVIALGRYRGGLRAVILAAKHRGAHAIIRRLGDALQEAVRPFGEITVIPMPSSRPGFLARGYGLSQSIAKTIGRPIADCLVLEDSGSQRDRSRSDRQKRAIQLGLHRPSVGTRVVIVDDVVTTGASANAAIRACHEAGIRVVAVVAIASAQERLSPGSPVKANPAVFAQNVSP